MQLHIIFIFVVVIVKASQLQEKSTFLTLFDDQSKAKFQKIYEVIPGSLMKFLETKEIVKPISFRSNFGVHGIGMGVDKHIVMHNFQIHLRQSIEKKFNEAKVDEIRPEDLSLDITQRYEGKLLNRPDPGKAVKAIIQFEKIYPGKEGGPYKTVVYAYVYMEIVEKCENNWIAANERRFDYHLKIEISGISVNRKKINDMREMIDRDGMPKTIEFIKSKAQLKWDDL